MSRSPSRPGRQRTEAEKKKARENLLRLRKKFPEKFNPKKNGALKKAAEVRSQPQPEAPQPQTAPAIAPEPEKIAPAPVVTVPEKPAAPVIPPPQPQTVPVQPQPTVTPPISATPITVSQDQLFSPPPAPGAQPHTDNAPPPAPEQPQPGTGQPQTAASKATNIALATMIWGMILRIAVMIFGDGCNEHGEPNPRTAAMLPKIMKTPAGDIDENANVITAFVEYFDSVGFVKLTPLWNLVLTVSAYFLLRIEVMIVWFKSRKERNAGKHAQRHERSEPAKPEAQPQPGKKVEPAQDKPQRQPQPQAEAQHTDAEPSFSQEPA